MLFPSGLCDLRRFPKCMMTSLSRNVYRVTPSLPENYWFSDESVMVNIFLKN